MNLTAVFTPCAEGGYMGHIDEIPGVVTQGETIEETRANLADALEMVLEANREISQQEQVAAQIREPLVLAA